MIDPSGRTTTLVYDAAGQLVERAHLGGETVTFGYDAAGRRVSATESAGTTTYAYDPVGALTELARPDGRTIGYEYDIAGRRTTMRYPDGAGVNYGYDTAGRLVSLTPTETMADSFTGPDGTALASAKWSVATPKDATATILDNVARLSFRVPLRFLRPADGRGFHHDRCGRELRLPLRRHHGREAVAVHAACVERPLPFDARQQVLKGEAAAQVGRFHVQDRLVQLPVRHDSPADTRAGRGLDASGEDLAAGPARTAGVEPDRVEQPGGGSRRRAAALEACGRFPHDVPRRLLAHRPDLAARPGGDVGLRRRRPGRL